MDHPPQRRERPEPRQQDPIVRLVDLGRRRLRNARFRDHIRSSLWFLPAIALLGAACLSLVTIGIDRHLDGAFSLPFEVAEDAESARGVLTLIGSWMLTFIGLAFTMTIVVLQTASSQLSPRVLSTLMRDRFSQLSLGVFVGTFAYAFMVARMVGTDVVPSTSVSVAFVLVFISLGFFIRYVNHVAQSVRATSMIITIAQATRNEYQSRWPRRRRTSRQEPWRPYRTIVAPHAGTLRSCDERSLVALARRWDIVFEVVPHVGGFVPRGAPLVRILGDSSEVDEGLVLSQIHVGRERTMAQDPSFGFRQLVDIAERALSPGVNDPTTAVEAIDQIHDLLRDLLFREIPTGTHLDRDGSVRLVVPSRSWEHYLELGVEEIRHYGAGSIQVSRRLERMLLDLRSVAPSSQTGAIDSQLHALRRVAEQHLAAIDTGEEHLDW